MKPNISRQMAKLDARQIDCVLGGLMIIQYLTNSAINSFTDTIYSQITAASGELTLFVHGYDLIEWRV